MDQPFYYFVLHVSKPRHYISGSDTNPYRTFGWVTVVVAIFVVDVLQSYPLTLNLSAWYAHPTYLALAAVVALTLYSFKVSLGDRPAFGDLLAEE